MDLPAPDRRKELTQALRACTHRQRTALRALPEHHGSPYLVATRLGISKQTMFNWLRDPRFVRARELLLEDAIEQIGVSHTYILGRTKEVVERCMQNVSPLLDRKGQHVQVETPDGDEAAAYVFDGRTALKGLEMLGRHRRLWGEERPTNAAPVGPGLTIVVQNGVSVQARVEAPTDRVDVRLPGPAR